MQKGQDLQELIDIMETWRPIIDLDEIVTTKKVKQRCLESEQKLIDCPQESGMLHARFDFIPVVQQISLLWYSSGSYGACHGNGDFRDVFTWHGFGSFHKLQPVRSVEEMYPMSYFKYRW